MKAALLADVGEMVVLDLSVPPVHPREVLIKVKAVGVCRIDLHLFRGDANYNLDSQGHPIPLAVQPQILGHEFCGAILDLGSEVRDLKRGDRVLCDQGRNCVSQNPWPRCPNRHSGNLHLCHHYGEPHVTGLPGAVVDYYAMAAWLQSYHYLKNSYE